MPVFDWRDRQNWRMSEHGRWLALALATACLGLLLMGSTLPERLAASKHDVTGTVASFTKAGSRATIYDAGWSMPDYPIHLFFLNGYYSLTFAGADQNTQAAETLVGVLPYFLTREHDQALVIGAGTGLTATGAAHAFDETTIIDIDPNAPALLRHFSTANDHVLSQPQIQLVADSGLTWLAQSDSTFDAVIMTPTVPAYAGANQVYTRAFMRQAHAHLKPGGVYVLWVDIRFLHKGAAIVQATLNTVFPYSRWFSIKPGYVAIIASDRPVAIRTRQEPTQLPAEQIRYLRRFFDPYRDAPEMRLIHAIRRRLATGLKTLPPDTPVNTLNHPVLRHVTKINGLFLDSYTFDDILEVP